MCLRIYIGSDIPLPTVNWDENQPKFYLKPGVDDSIPKVQSILECNYVYEAGSFMGCGCGLYLDSEETDEPDDKTLRCRDIGLFKEYLITNRRTHSIKIFTTWWEKFPEVYPSITIEIEKLIDKQAFFEDDVVYFIC